MPTKRQKPIHPYIEKLMSLAGFSEIKPFARHIQVDERNLYYIADGSAGQKILKHHYDLAQALNIPLDEYFRGYLNIEA